MFHNLKENDLYQAQWFCSDMRGYTSTPMLYEWQTPPNSGALVKVIVTTDTAFSLLQRLNLVCSINQLFTIVPSRIFD
jgi:hypothetical protein